MIAALAIPAVRPLLTDPVTIFLMVMGVILLVPMLFNRLKIPPVIGYIVAGVVVGPYGTNLLARDMSFEVFGQVGVLYLMFLAGLEIDLFNLRRNLRSGLTFGLLTFLIPMVVGTVAGWSLLGLTFLSSLLLASMFAAHTLIGYPIVARYGLTKNRAVVIAVAGTVFTVLGSLLVLAAVMGVFQRGEFSLVDILRLLGSLAIYLIAIAYIYPRVTRWFFRHYADGILQFVYILAMTFLAAQAAVWIGLEAVFGAFCGGIVLGRFVPARSTLMGRLEFVGNALFIPYFLIGVGMLINVKVIAGSWSTVYAAAVMSAVAIAVKWLAAYATQRLSRLPSLERSMLFQLSNAHTAVALAVVMIGYSTGLFGEEILNGTVVMILVTCTVSSLGVGRAASRMKLRQLEEKAMEGGLDRAPDHSTLNTLIPIANPLTATELVGLAIMMRGENTRGDMYALHVRTDNSAPSKAISRASLDVARQVAASVEASVTPIERYDINFITGVTNVMEERDISQVIIGLHRRTQVIDSFFGEKLTQLLKATNRMVVITRLFVPAATLMRIVATVPEKAHFEIGFQAWVRALGHLTRQIGCPIVFCCFDETRRAIETILRVCSIDIERTYRLVGAYDDFILLANKIAPDDLLVSVNARRGTLSFTSDMDSLPDFLRHHFAANNLMVIYPEQSTDTTLADISTLADTMIADVTVAPSPLLLKAKAVMRSLFDRLTGRRPSSGLDL
ncbi:MAG: cation:proton antiporter [Pseudoflavonifractor sp.]|nr:cation:proton antiporter [Alloprevotella sp.]MCM1116004.1 cation:proton antiporter [Pseudoflavonifractor sp.]